jgi:hypothetical protein
MFCFCFEINYLVSWRTDLRETIWSNLFIIFYFFICYNTTSHNLIVFKSVVWKKGDESFRKCHPGFGCGIEPRSSPTKGVCATNAPLHIHFTPFTYGFYERRHENIYLFISACFSIIHEIIETILLFKPLLV